MTNIILLKRNTLHYLQALKVREKNWGIKVEAPKGLDQEIIIEDLKAEKNIRPVVTTDITYSYSFYPSYGRLYFILKGIQMWIGIEEKSLYMDSLKQGLKTHFEKVNICLKNEIVLFIKWLRKNYWFPIELSVRFLEDKFIIGDNEKKAPAIFLYQTTWDNNDLKDKVLPEIIVATGKYQKQLKRHKFSEVIFNYLFSIAHEITHYYQWYFYEFDSRTDRSLEIEANRWGGYIAETYMETLS